MIKIRCSSLGKIMTDPKLKTDKEAGNLSETAKTYIEELFLYKNYGYREIVQTDEMKKGNLCEVDSMILVQQVLKGDLRTRYKKNIENDYITGTPDIVLSDCVEDIKTSWNLRTFFNAEPDKLYTAPDKLYTAQGQGYMELTGKKKFRLIYCLVPTPPEIMFGLEKKLFYQYDNHDNNKDYQDAMQQLYKNNDLILDIPLEKRVKVFEYNYDGEYIKYAYRRIAKAREYYSTLRL